jgi:bis(5'-adenosyl)-triphosphatase
VHVHIIPRKETDYGGVNDEIYPALEGAERDLRDDLVGTEEEKEGEGDNKSAWVKDEDRKPRSMEVMEEEARWLASLF